MTDMKAPDAAVVARVARRTALGLENVRAVFAELKLGDKLGNKKYVTGPMVIAPTGDPKVSARGAAIRNRLLGS